jgi:hypothetical protein
MVRVRARVMAIIKLRYRIRVMFRVRLVLG